MISETRTKVISWLKSPKNAVIAGAATVAVVSVGTASAFTLTGMPAEHKNNAEVAQTAETSQNTTPQSTDTSTATAQPTDTSTSNTTNTTPQQTNTASTDTPQPPVAPVAPTYADTYPSEWKTQCDAPYPDGLDTWYQNKCQATSYAAWKVNESFGNMPKNWGDANSWLAKASAAGISTSTTPKAHSVGVQGNFVIWVEAVNSDGTIDVSYYNFGYSKAFGYKTSIPAATYSSYIYF